MSNRRHIPIDPILLARARQMRHDPAPAEQKLWAFLRDSQLGGFKFRRQVAMGSFIADFYCPEVDLVVELDGESHLDRATKDQSRTEILNRTGHHVIRFWNNDIFENLDGVLTAILEEAERLSMGRRPHPNPLPGGEGVRAAVQILRRGGLVAFPTETVYGLGADATNADAVRRIFQAKGRPGTNPLICHVADVPMARRYARVWPDVATQLAEAFWPGPLTLVLPKTDAIVSETTAGRDTVGLRAPNQPLMLQLLREFARPIAGPSANKSNHVSPTTAQHVRDELGDEVDLILDGGPCSVGIESTVVDLSTEVPSILRPGGISREQIEQLVGPVEMKSNIVDPGAPALSPGQHAVHYAPRTPAFRFNPNDRAKLDMNNAAIVELTLDPETYARNLYARLRLLDTQSLRAIYIEAPPDRPEWAAVRDRIMRATRALP